MHWLRWEFWKRFWALLEVPEPDPARIRERLAALERDIVLPVKFGVIVMLAWHFAREETPEVARSALDLATEAVQWVFGFYAAATVVGAGLLAAVRRAPLALLQWGVFLLCLTDALFLGALTLITGGYDSILFWMFPILILRNAWSVPPAMSQLTLNLCTCLAYVLAGVLDVAISQDALEAVDYGTRLVLDQAAAENPTEPLLLRVTILVLTALCAYGVQVLWDRQQRAAAEAREFAVREAQLQSAGRLAAEIAHQLKNPLGIISNTLFTLRRALAAGRTQVEPQLQIITEEVERSDRILTQLMDYAQLSEGRVEKLDVATELEAALAQVFPAGAGFATRIEKQVAANLPPLFMQRGHLQAIFTNILQNAREVLQGGGTVRVEAALADAETVQVIIADDGPGIPPEQREQIFEPYFTTKEKGTGLGLAIVKHNLDLYGGRVRVESEVGKGARFILSLPTKALHLSS